ncbi:MAG: AMP-binding protein, partial [Planctomycetes bacterium]|nr:AMP-binding protein [Planctomycetota bacterium]
MAAPAQTIEALLKENRTFSPPPAFVERANCSDPGVYERAARDPEAWWASWAERLSWSRRWDKVLEWRAPVAKWFAGGKINASAQCLDRHVRAGLGGRVALYWEGEPGDARVLTYADMLAGASRLGNALRELGVGRGDRVAVYMPMVPELAMTLLACARIGAVFSVVFGGFSANALKERINDQKARLVICADGCWRRGKVLDLKAVVDEAVAGCPTVEKVLVWRRGKGVATAAKGGPRDVEWSAVVDRQYDTCRAEEMDAEDPLFILYTSGTTGKPKGIFHTTGGYLVGVYATTNYVFDLKPDRDIYWCTADIGWVTGHSYIVFGPMAHAATQVMYEGAPDWPRPDRFWELIEKYRVTVFYTAPTAIRAFMKWGDEHPAAHNLASLRLLGSVGEPINPEAWIWYHARIGGGRCPIVDTWWQTETGMILITPLPGLTETV